MSMRSHIKKTAVPCYDKAMDLLAFRAHSRAELERKLLERGYTEDEVCDAVKRLINAHLLDDKAYAERQTELMIQGKGFAPRRIMQELRRRGVDGDTIAAAIDAVEDYDPLETISAMLERKFARNLNTEQGRRRTVNALVRMGYGWSDIRRAMSNFKEEENNYE